MAFSRHTSRIYIDEDDIKGALNVLSRRITDNSDPGAINFYIGAHLTLNLIFNHEQIRDQSVFMKMFDTQLYEHGYINEFMKGNEIA